MLRLIHWVSLTILLFACAPSVLFAGEFGNLLFPKDLGREKQSREASAAAIRGIEHIIIAIEHSELREIGSRQESLEQAAELLSDAVKKMQAISLEDKLHLPLRLGDFNQSELQYIIYIRESVLKEQGPPKDVGELYGDFIAFTKLLSEEAKTAVNSKETTLPRKILLDTSSYLSFGSEIADLLEITLKAG